MCHAFMPTTTSLMAPKTPGTACFSCLLGWWLACSLLVLGPIKAIMHRTVCARHVSVYVIRQRYCKPRPTMPDSMRDSMSSGDFCISNFLSCRLGFLILDQTSDLRIISLFQHGTLRDLSARLSISLFNITLVGYTETAVRSRRHSLLYLEVNIGRRR
ncbi:hypothetical protein FOVG_00619 [Fusarium oxysporum f. sp. pisi HDV247]|uniref:Uncharacterized protein n=2 Tax=Fusarium oxysporum f. sp. pisi HDV247 TaxID=1080344 RepID=W9QAI3_FUSOX|nr:hypothetical protein FOVG_00619 [Fusarium oxysporum f. sp. pisi HDV247]EXA52261.1 hypothetical protein FOVG_00619 [Fusarium oxysporum f. sp. pisi HDV247]EXA52262.1 hypothetical protein FOVG_00619 [Fusarium oxysporum f. sp. pisi HDV247]EXA52263.1 hypothetical protein FOVG_00619 [Fusarium oxysporum f. sp. pisi HDV247]